MLTHMSEYTGCILAGGLGTRLRSCISDRPKVLAPVAGQPFLNYILQQFSNSGIKRCVLCTGHLAAMIEEEYGNNYAGMELLYSYEDSPLGTAGALKNAEHLLTGDKLIVANGDSFFGADLTKAATEFDNGKHPAMIVLNHISNTARYGRVELNAKNIITSFREKDGVNAAGLINAGIYFLHRDFLERIPADKQVSLEREIFPQLISGNHLGGWSTTGIFIDIGTPESYTAAQELAQTSIKEHLNSRNRY